MHKDDKDACEGQDGCKFWEGQNKEGEDVSKCYKEGEGDKQPGDHGDKKGPHGEKDGEKKECAEGMCCMHKDDKDACEDAGCKFWEGQDKEGEDVSKCYKEGEGDKKGPHGDGDKKGPHGEKDGEKKECAEGMCCMHKDDKDACEDAGCKFFEGQDKEGEAVSKCYKEGEGEGDKKRQRPKEGETQQE